MRRRPLILAAVGLACLLAAYTVYWFVLARVVARDIADWENQQRAGGFVVVIGEPVIDGFPFAVRARLPAPDITAPDGAWHWQGPDTLLRVAPWAPFDLQFEAAGPHHLRLAGNAPRELAVHAGELALDLDFTREGRLSRFSLEVGDARLADSISGNAGAASLVIEGDLPWPVVNDAMHSSLDLTIDGTTIELPPGIKAALGQRIEKVHMISQLMGMVPPLMPREALAGWRDAGGVLQLRESEIDWGPLWAAGDGTLALDQSMQPLAAGSLRIAGLSETLDALTAEGLLQPDPAKLAKLMFAALARPPVEGGRPEVKLPLTIQNGFLYMGPLKLARLQPIDWSRLP